MSDVDVMSRPDKNIESRPGQTNAPLQPMPDLADYVREYARQKPEVAALWCFGIGFVLGWKLKPW